MTIHNEVTVNTLIFLCSNWWNLPTMKYKTQLASMWSISCNIQHLAQQQGQHKIQWSMLWKRTFCHFWRANMANWRRNPHDVIIKWMKARVAWRQKGPKRWEHCADYDLKRSFQRRNVRKCTFQAPKKKRNGSMIMWIERPQWQESEFKTHRQRLCNSTNIWGMLKWHDQQPQSQKQHLRRSWTRSETVWAILPVPKMMWMGKMRMMLKQMHSLASWAKMIDLAGWWAQSPKRYSTSWRAFGRSRWGLKIRLNRDGGDAADYHQSAMIHATIYKLSAQTSCTWSNNRKLLMVHHENQGQSAG